MTRTTRRIVLVIVAGVAVFATISIYADVSELSDRLAGFGWWALAAALALALCNYAVRFVRWSLYLAHRDISVPLSISAITFLSGFALSITPGKLGELIKSYLLRASSGVPMTRSAPIVVAERLTDLLALLLLGLFGVTIYGVARSMVLAGAVVIGAGLFFLAWPPAAHWAIRQVARIPRLAPLGDRLRLFYDGLAALVTPRPLAWATALGTVAWLAECIGFTLIISAFPGTDVPMGLATLIYATTTVAGALSFLPGGLVVTEATMALLLVQSSRGVDQATAVAATILTRLATLWFAVLLGLLALAVLRRVAPSSTHAFDDPDRKPASGDDPGGDRPGGASDADQAEIRLAGPGDLEAVRAFYAALDYGGSVGDDDIVVTAWLGDELVGVVRLVSEHGVLVLRGMRVASHLQRRGLGKRMLATLASQVGAQPCYCLAHDYLAGFYGGIGFVPVAEPDLPPHLVERAEVYRARNPSLVALCRPV